jgi:hypothetical protein
MPALVLGVIVLILLLFAAYSFSKADPKHVVRVLRYIGGGAVLLFAVFLLTEYSNADDAFSDHWFSKSLSRLKLRLLRWVIGLPANAAALNRFSISSLSSHPTIAIGSRPVAIIAMTVTK